MIVLDFFLFTSWFDLKSNTFFSSLFPGFDDFVCLMVCEKKMEKNIIVFSDKIKTRERESNSLCVCVTSFIIITKKNKTKRVEI